MAYPLEYSGGEPVGLGGHSDAGFPTEQPLTGRKWGDPGINCTEVDSPFGRYDREITELDGRVHVRLRDDVGYRVIQQLSGVGRVFAGVFVAEIGDIDRFPNPKRLCSWVGLTPRHRESDDKVIRGSITKQGSALVRWAAVEAVVRWRGGAPIQDSYRRIAERRGTNIARVAAARKLLTLVYYGIRDGEIRCLREAA